MELFKLAAHSHIPPKYLEMYNKPARNNIQEVRIIEMYQFGALDIYKSICLTDEELKHIVFLLSNNTVQNQVNMNQLNKVIETGVAFLKTVQLI